MTDLLEALNEAQQEAVTGTEGFVRVIAGAGSGKTRALAHRFAYLVNEIGVPAGNILCVTFTNRSAAEMRRRIRALTGDNDTGYISTFHGFCVSVLQEDSHAVQYPKSFLVLDNADINEMLRIIYEERGLTLRHRTFADARDMIEMRKCLRNPDYFEDMIALPLETLRQKYLDASETDDMIFYGYLYEEKKCFGLDYNDLIKYVLHIFHEDETIRLKWQKRLAYIMIDEFQDIDQLQYELMQALAGHHQNLFVVGDPDQTIYTWRGANVRFLLDFERAFPGTRTIFMMRNYRSTPEILAAANSLVDKNRQRVKKSLLPTLPSGAPVRYHHAKTADDEALWIVSCMRVLANAGAPLSDMAVLYRAHYVSRALEETFLHEELPYTIYSGTPFFERMEIKDALSYLRLVAYRDDLSFLRIANVPKRNIGERRMRALRDYAAKHGCLLYDALVRLLDDELFQNTKARQFVALVERFSAKCHGMPLSDLLAAVLNESGYEAALRTEGGQERLDNLAELKQSVHDYEITCGEEGALEDYLARVALLTNADAGAAKNAVRLMSVHTAKGLEFPYVFLCGLNEGVFPSKKTATLESMEEERRLAFVAFTRAKRALFLSEAEGRNLDGSFRYPSRFIFDVDKGLLCYDEELNPSLVSDSARHIRLSEELLAAETEEPAFAVGTRVKHPIMGAGVVVEIDRANRAYVIRFDELFTERKLTFRAPLGTP